MFLANKSYNGASKILCMCMYIVIYVYLHCICSIASLKAISVICLLKVSEIKFSLCCLLRYSLHWVFPKEVSLLGEKFCIALDDQRESTIKNISQLIRPVEINFFEVSLSIIPFMPHNPNQVCSHLIIFCN